jgi:hypothetical protein
MSVSTVASGNSKRKTRWHLRNSRTLIHGGRISRALQIAASYERAAADESLPTQPEGSVRQKSRLVSTACSNKSKERGGGGDLQRDTTPGDSSRGRFRECRPVEANGPSKLALNSLPSGKLADRAGRRPGNPHSFDLFGNYNNACQRNASAILRTER